MNKKLDFNILDRAMKTAPMLEKKAFDNYENKVKKKLINIPTEWEEKIKSSYKGTINSYILIAIYERMQKDSII